MSARIALAILLLFASPAFSQSLAVAIAPIEFSGSEGVVSLDVAALSALPQVEQTVTFKTSKGVSTGVYKGPLLWDVVQSAKGIEGLGHNQELAKTLMVSASDGYQIAFSIGELAPEFGNAMVLLALETDGVKLADGYRIVVQGDKRGARALHNITKIEIR